MHRAISEENGRKIGNFRLKVEPAKFDKPLATLPQPHPKPLNLNSDRQKIPTSLHSSALRDTRSYKEVFSQGNPQTKDPDTTKNFVPSQEYEPQPDFLENNPMSEERILSSKLLGEEVLSARKNVGADDFDGETVCVVKGTTNKENDEMFDRSVVGIATAPSHSNSILDQILAEGVLCLNIRPLGGLLHLITFETKEDKQAMIDSQWLLNWFSELKEVDKNISAIWRETWINILGVPLAA